MFVVLRSLTVLFLSKRVENLKRSFSSVTGGRKVLDQAQAPLADQMQRHPGQLAAFDHITALIEEVRQCWTPTQYRMFQQSLGKHIEQVDALAEDASSRRNRCEERLRRLPSHKNLDPDAATKLTQEHQNADFEQKLSARLGKQYW
jgi:hypothetical protein